MVSLKEKLEADFPGLFDKESELAQKKRDTWDRFAFPEPSTDPKNRNFAEFIIYAPFEEAQGTLTDKDGNILPLYRLKVINMDGLKKQTIMAGESVVRSLIADVINNDILLDDDMTKMSGLAYNVETIIMKGEKNRVWNDVTQKYEQKRFHKFAIDVMRSIPEEKRNKEGIEEYLGYMENKRKEMKQDKELKDKGVDTNAKANAEALFGKINIQPPMAMATENNPTANTTGT